MYQFRCFYIVHTTIIGLQHFDQRPHYTGGSIELSGKFAFLLCKFRKAVFVGSAEDITAAACIYHFNIGEQVNYIAQTALIEFGTRKVLGEDVLQSLVFLLDCSHGIVDDSTNFGSVSF